MVVNAGHLLGDEETDAVRLPRFVQLDDVRMILQSRFSKVGTYQLHQNVDLVLERLVVSDLALLHGLDRDHDA